MKQIMPIYEYYCPDNDRIYSFLAKTVPPAGQVPKCPNDPSFRMVKLVSGFAVTGRAKESPAGAGYGPEDLDDARMESAMAEMERDMEGIDDENPDPRQLGHLMRKMADLSGEKIPRGMEEMVRRLEAGEDPESLEEEYGDLLDEELGGFDADETERTHQLETRGNTPRRDPTLYDLSDYLA